MICLPLLCTLLLLTLAAPAAAMVQLPESPVPVAGNPAGNPQALARRMRVEELIWDCGYWSAGMTQFTEYRRGAAARTSFWSKSR